MKYLFAVIATLIAFTSCEEDGDKIYLQSLSGNELMASTDEVKLNADVAQQIVLSFAWTDQTIAISDENVGTAVKVVTSLEASLSEDFSGTVSRTETTSLSHAFTGAELNTIANTIGATIGQSNAVWFRLGSATGTNIPSAYSNAVQVNVTPYEMDMHTGIILDASKNATGETLYSANADGIYSGFMTANAWENFYMREGNGIVWGNVGDDGGGTPFVLSSEPTQWNMWFPNAEGCFHVTVDTKEEEWSALHVSSLAVGGLADGDIAMTFDKTNGQWLATFTADAPGSRTITISGQGELFNASTGTDAGSATDIAFAMEGENLVLAETAGSVNVEVPQAGECTLRLNLSDPKNCTATVEAGSAEVPVVYPSELKMISSDGTELLTLPQTGEQGKYTAIYTGLGSINFKFVDQTSDIWYGYIYTEDETNDPFKLDGSGTDLYFEGGWSDSNVNYIITVDLNDMTWGFEPTSSAYPSSIAMYQFDKNAWTKGEKVIDLTQTEEGKFTGIFQGEYGFDFMFIDENGTLYGTTWSEDNQNGTRLETSPGQPLWIYGYDWGVSLNITINVDLTNMTWSYTENN